MQALCLKKYWFVSCVSNVGINSDELIFHTVSKLIEKYDSFHKKKKIKIIYKNI